MAKANAPEKTAQDQAEKIDLSGFDYSNLTGAKFREYVELVGDRSFRIVTDDGDEVPVVGKLKQEEMLEFACYKVEVMRKQRYKGVKDSPFDFVGVKTKTERPEFVTRITVKTALENNAQILNAHSLAGYGKYYLLKK